MKWFAKCIRNYVNFKGRARRAEFWYFILFAIIFMMIAYLADLLILKKQVLSPLFSLFIFLPELAVGVRRLHDTNRSGLNLLWYYLFGAVWIGMLIVMGFTTLFAAMAGGGLGAMSAGYLVLLIGGGLISLIWGILFLVWYCQKGTPGENKYGPDPKAITE